MCHEVPEAPEVLSIFMGFLTCLPSLPPLPPPYLFWGASTLIHALRTTLSFVLGIDSSDT